MKPINNLDEIVYTSCAARWLAWLVYVPPFNWISNMQHRVSSAQMKQIFGEYDAQPISLALIVRERQQSPLPLAIPSIPDGSN